MDNVWGQPAGFWRRFAALLLNLIYFIPIYSLIGLLVHGGSFLYRVLVVSCPVVCSVMFLSSRWQATPGKRAFGIYVIRADDGQPVSKQRAFCRYMAFSVPYILGMTVAALMSPIDTSKPDSGGVLLGVYVIAQAIYYVSLAYSIGLSPDKRGFIDKMCHTCVIRGRPDRPLSSQPLSDFP